MTTYLYRRGDGNDGNFPRYLVDISDKDNPWSALKALVCNDYIAGKRVRRFIANNIEIDGEREYGINAMILEGPEGESAYGAAWITAELQVLGESDLTYYEDNGTQRYALRKVLDNAALRLYRADLKGKRS